MSTRRLTTATLVILCSLAGTLLFTVGSATAGAVHHYLSDITEVPTEPGVLGGPFAFPRGIASDSGNLYVLDSGGAVIDEFDSTNAFLRQVSGQGIFEFDANRIAVSHATGDIYVFGSFTSDVNVFNAAGGLLTNWSGQSSPGKAFEGFVHGVAVDNSTNPLTAGDVYVSDGGNEYVPGGGNDVVDVLKPGAGGSEEYVTQLTGTPLGAFGEPVGMAVDPASGDLVVVDGGVGFNDIDVFKPKPGHEYEFLFQLKGPPGQTFANKEPEHNEQERELESVAVDGANGDIYAADNGRDAVYQFTATGEYLGEITGTQNGRFGSVAGVTVNSNTRDLYVLDTGSGPPAVDVFGPSITVPDASSASPTIGAQSVTFNGAVNPRGTPATACEFEYGSSKTYGASVECSSVPGLGTSPVAVSADVSLAALGAGATYHYRLAVTDEEGETVHGEDKLFITPPQVQTVALASNITSFAATLTGVFEPGGATPTYHFVYGLTSSYGSSAPQPDAAADAGVQQTVTQVLTGLQPDATYHFALVATNFGGGESVGPDQTFTTRPLVPPKVSTGAADAIGQTTATVTGTLNPEELPTTYRFEYGLSADYGASWPALPVFAGTSGTNEAVAIGIPNLQPAVTYHYRLAATNEDGTSYGADQTFSTAGYPASIVQEPPVLPSQKAPAVKAKKPAAKHRQIKKKKKTKKKSRKPKKK